jgi:hypothetical protein
MELEHDLKSVPDDELLRRLGELLRQSRRVEADLIAHIGEVERRRLYAREAAPSMFVYCTRQLHLSEAEAYLRITVARASRQHPILLEMLKDGRLHLTGIARLSPHLTASNRSHLLERAVHGSRRGIEELVAELVPRPDAPATMRKLPVRRAHTGPAPGAELCPDRVVLPLIGAAADAGAPSLASVDPQPVGSSAPPPALATAPPSALATAPPSAPATASAAANSGSDGLDLRPDKVDGPRVRDSASTGGLKPGPAAEAVTAASAGAGPQGAELRLDRVGGVRPNPAKGRVEPLAPARYKVQFTASAELRDKLERLQALMRASVPDGDLGAIIEQAVSEKLERLEARRFAKTNRPRQTGVALHSQALATIGAAAGAAAGSRHIPAAVRRAVHQRDEGRCRFVDDRGRRCPAQDRLEFHHRHPFALGGDCRPENIQLLCRTHNQHVAEADYGQQAIARHRSPSDRVFEASGTHSSTGLTARGT